MVYTPYFLALNGTIQCILFMICEISLQLVFRFKIDRELFKLSDGGTIALDWISDHEGGFPLKGSKRPILCCISGLSGGNDNYYTYSMVKEGMRQGYKCVIINFRGAGGVPLTSKKFYWTMGWKDLKEPIDYINNKFCNSKDLEY